MIYSITSSVDTTIYQKVKDGPFSASLNAGSDEILEIQKESQVQRVVLDGYDSFQSEVNVLMGTDRDAENNVSYSVNNIYRYNNNKTLENTNLT